jgi:hypothetical protein
MQIWGGMIFLNKKLGLRVYTKQVMIVGVRAVKFAISKICQEYNVPTFQNS